MADVRAPVSFWYGDQDTVTPAYLCHEAFASIRDKQFFVIPNEAHYSMPFNYAATILEALVRTT